MAYLRKIKTKTLKAFGDLCDKTLKMVLIKATKASRIDFVFDTYIEGSIKDAERVRRSTQKAIEINNIVAETRLPVDMETFWSSNSNKTKLQLLFRHDSNRSFKAVSRNYNCVEWFQ